MTPPPLQIAMAKAMGWKSQPNKYYADGFGWTKAGDSEVWSTDDLPALTLDLMFKAEEMLKGDERWKYAELLIKGRSYWHAFHTTAEERAEAWLKVKGISVETNHQTTGHHSSAIHC